MVIFVFKTPQFLMNFHDNSKNENRKIDFSFDKNKQKKLTFCLVGILSVDILFVDIMSHNRLEITDDNISWHQLF